MAGTIMPAPDVRLIHDARGTPVTIRTITPADRDIEATFVRGLSDQSRYYRFHAALRELTPELLERFTFVSFPDNMALIATIEVEGREQQIAVARFAASAPDGSAAELAVVVADEWQGRGIGTRLLVELRDIALAAGYRRLHMSVLSENGRMMDLARRLGFVAGPPTDGFVSRELGKSISVEPDD